MEIDSSAFLLKLGQLHFSCKYLFNIADVVSASLQQMVNRRSGFFQSFMFAFGTDAKNGDVWHSFS